MTVWLRVQHYMGVRVDISCLYPTKNVPDPWWPVRVWGIPYPSGKVEAYLNLQSWSKEVGSGLNDGRTGRR